MKIKRKASYDPITQSYLLPLTRGKFATIDAEDVAWAEQWSWQCTRDGYAARGQHSGSSRETRTSKTVLMHAELAARAGVRLADGQTPDHVNRNKLDNRRENIRPATRSQQCVNRGQFRNNTSGRVGVSFRKDIAKWAAYIGSGKRLIHLGFFATKDEAVAARARAEAEIHGEFARKEVN